MNTTLTLATTALVALAATTHAAESELRPYVGLDVTRVMADYKDGNDMLFKDDLNGVSPYVGVQFNKYVGAEISYLQTGNGKKSPNLSANIPGYGVATLDETKIKVSGFSLDAVGRLPITADEKLTLLGSAGIGRYKADATYSGSLAGVPVSVKDDTKDTALRLGAGAQYQITDNIGARAMVRYIKADFDDVVDNLVTASVGLNYRF